jgi:hypothetical protein
MNDGTMDPQRLSDLAATVGHFILAIEELQRVKLSMLLASVRSGVMQRADALRAESPPAIVFNPL